MQRKSVLSSVTPGARCGRPVTSEIWRDSAISTVAERTSAPAETPRPARRSRSPPAPWSPSAPGRSSRNAWKPTPEAPMLDPGSNREIPPIPAKRYFTIGEVSELCDVKPHVLRYWETEFPSLSPVKRRGNRRYYQRHDVLMVRQIRGLLYEQGYTIGGARQRLEGEGAKQESALSTQIVKQVRMELEEILQLLRR